MSAGRVISRKYYRKLLVQLIEKNRLVFVIGPRRTGKSTFAEELAELMKRHAPEGVFIGRINFEDKNIIRMPVEELLEQFKARYAEGMKNVFIVDEISHIVDWEQALNEVMRLERVKVILLSSTRSVYSARLEPVSKGECAVVEMAPMSLGEFVTFHGFKPVSASEPVCECKRFRAYNESILTLKEIYELYGEVGGMPVVGREQLLGHNAWISSEGTYCSIVTHDMLEVGSKVGKTNITDPLLLRTIITELARTAGTNISATQIGKRTVEYLQRPSSTKTVESYLRAILNSGMFYISERFDIKNGVRLKTLAKFYFADTSVFNYVTGSRRPTTPALLENLVFLEFLRRGSVITNGKLGQDEVTFVLDPDSERVYVQVPRGEDDATRQRALTTLRRIKDNHPKVLIEMRTATKKTSDGILIMNALEFLMGAKLK